MTILSDFDKLFLDLEKAHKSLSKITNSKTAWKMIKESSQNYITRRLKEKIIKF